MHNRHEVGGAGDGLVDVPLFDVEQPAAEALMTLAFDRLDLLIGQGQRHYGRLVLAAGDRLTWKWLRRSANPYLDEIEGVRRRLGRPGAVLLNMSYEWSCTTAVVPDAAGGMRLLRTLDWPLPGLGRTVLVARQRGAAGSYYSVTWPGYVGVLTGMAPGRFSAAINQPPLRWITGIMPLDWVIARLALWRETGLPATHLLRRVFDACRSYAEAKRMLIETPLCLPAFFTLAGTGPDEGCVIERRQNAAAVHEAPAAISNHWVGFGMRGHDRGYDSRRRRALMTTLAEDADGRLSWLRPPILNPTTRLAAVANAARGLLSVQGWEKHGPVTNLFTLPPSNEPAV
jgi:hypothetical protein